MIKTPRFLVEYANWKIKTIEDSKLLHQDEKSRDITRINKAVFQAQRGYITIEEALKDIMNCNAESEE